MRMRCLSLVLSLTMALPVSAAHEVALEVLQPMDLVTGVSIRTTTYVRSLGDFPPGLLVPLTTEDNCLVMESRGPENRNAASLLRIRAGSDPRHARMGGVLFGDTLKVFLDLSHVTANETPRGWSLDAVVRATLECVLANASRNRTGHDPVTGKRIEARYVQVEVRGSRRFVDIAGVHSFADLGPLPRKTLFQQ